MGRGLEYTFLQRRCIDDWHMKRRSESLIIMEVQIKTTMRCQLTWLLSKNKTKKPPENNKCWRGGGATGTLLLCRWEQRKVCRCGKQYDG